MNCPKQQREGKKNNKAKRTLVPFQKEIERRTKKKRKYESAASALVKEINWSEPINHTGPAELKQENREINWQEPEGR